MIRGVILDGDGTIFDSLNMWSNFAADCLQDLNLPSDAIAPGELKNASLREAAQIFISRFGLSQTEDEMLAYFQNRLREIYANDIDMIAGAPQFLAELETRNIPCMIATAGDGQCVRAVLRRYGLEATCEGVFDCTSVPVGKSDPAMYDLARSRMNLGKEEVMIFEDALYALQTASRSGYPCTAICSPSDPEYALKSACADLVMKDYLDMDAFWALCHEHKEQKTK